LHFDLGEWAYRDGAWVRLYEVVPPDDPAAVADEAARQLVAFRNLVGRDPSHLDSHQQVHREEPARSILGGIARDLGLPLRHETAHIRYCGDFYGQDAKGTPLSEAIGVEALLRILERLPPGITELGCHPGRGDDLEGMYRAEREEEARTLCDPRVRAALAELQIGLRSFSAF
ncbi:MAG TPA: ChbG/HpnK family deacetylase, partial [Thermoanaerobaculia bacterium]|nr:ChbG/HpnK family deacetylase [Thermoanaerobaculia bacterium]